MSDCGLTLVQRSVLPVLRRANECLAKIAYCSELPLDDSLVDSHQNLLQPLAHPLGHGNRGVSRGVGEHLHTFGTCTKCVGVGVVHPVTMSTALVTKPSEGTFYDQQIAGLHFV